MTISLEETMKRVVTFAFLILIFVCSTPVVTSAETSFTISPPPITNPKFEKNESSGKFDLTLISISSDNYSAGGGGGDLKLRHAFTDFLAIDGQIGAYAIGGEYEDSDRTTEMSTFPMSANLEVQPYKNDSFNFILFGGGNYQYSSLTSENDNDEFEADLYLSGFQVGAQVGIFLDSFLLSPFAYHVTKSGTLETEDRDIDVDSVDANVIGFDIKYIPWNLSLSTLLQAAEQATDDDDDQDSGDSTTLIFQLGYSW